MTPPFPLRDISATLKHRLSTMIESSGWFLGCRLREHAGLAHKLLPDLLAGGGSGSRAGQDDFRLVTGFLSYGRIKRILEKKCFPAGHAW
jgi:hypothetical protein